MSGSAETLEKLPVPLLQWYGENARTLPWRSDPTPYHVWISEIMLQQTRVGAVLEHYRRFLEELPDVQTLAEVSEDRLFKLWQGLGYYSRARNLRRAAREIVTRFGGEFPRTFADVRSLPGIGDYTAGAICAIAFGLPELAVDGNLLRVTARLTADGGDVSAPGMKRKVTEELRKVLPVRMAGQFNQAMMDLGATVCLPNGAPLCEKCPAAAFCLAHRAGEELRYPVRAPKKPRRTESRNVYLIFSKRRVALRRRPEKGLLGGLWEYPNAPEAEKDAPAKWRLAPARTEFAAEGRHVFTHILWEMKAYKVFLPDDTLPEGWVWADREELLQEYAVPSAFGAFRRCVKEEL